MPNRRLNNSWEALLSVQRQSQQIQSSGTDLEKRRKPQASANLFQALLNRNMKLQNLKSGSPLKSPNSGGL
jgi:hypothetical protein